jgi:hypothetical protein
MLKLIGLGAAAAVALTPAVIGLAGNPSLSQQVPVQNVQQTHSSSSPTSTATPRPTGTRGREAEPGDDRGTHTAEPGDDRGTHTAEPGDDNNRNRHGSGSGSSGSGSSGSGSSGSGSSGSGGGGHAEPGDIHGGHGADDGPNHH